MRKANAENALSDPNGGEKSGTIRKDNARTKPLPTETVDEGAFGFTKKETLSGQFSVGGKRGAYPFTNRVAKTPKRKGGSSKESPSFEGIHSPK